MLLHYSMGGGVVVVVLGVNDSHHHWSFAIVDAYLGLEVAKAWRYCLYYTR